MLDLTTGIKYKIEDKPSYKLLKIKIIDSKLSEKDKVEIKKLVDKVNNDECSYKLLLEFECLEDINLDKIKEILNLYGDKFSSYISNNIKLLVCIIPNIIIINTIRLYLYFKEFDLPIKLVSNISDVDDILD
tara:strand:+ start:3225 stop:3620 length:396 start_codon:yes stop_codon:yes gene_type:complete